MMGADDLVSRSLLAIAVLGLTVLGVLGLLWLLRTRVNRRTLCVALLLIGFLLDVLLVEPPSIQLGLQIYSIDVVALLMAVTVLASFLFRQLPIRGLPTLLWLTLGLVMLMSFAVGTEMYGKTAGVDARPNIYFWIAGLYCCVIAFDEQDIKQMARWCVWTAYALMGIAIYRWLGFLTGIIPLKDIVEVGAGNEFRALHANQAFCIAAVGLVQLMAWIRGTGTRWSGLHALVLAVLVVVLQHRSVWVSYAAGFALVLVLEQRNIPKRLPWLIGLTLVAGISVGIATEMRLLDRLFASLWESVISVADPRSTATDRVFGWEALMSDWIDSSPGTILFGYPYGASYSRVVDRVVEEYSPHNFYVQLLLRVGLVGTFLFIAATLMAMLHSLRAKTESEFEHLSMRGMGLTLFASMVYYVPYQGFYMHGAITGLALAQIVRYRLLGRAQLRDRTRMIASQVHRQTR